MPHALNKFLTFLWCFKFTKPLHTPGHIYSLQSIQDFRVHHLYFIGEETECREVKRLGLRPLSGHHLRIITLTFQDVTLLSPCSPLLRPVLPLSQLSGALSRKAGLFLWRAKSVHHSVFCFLPSKILLLSSSLLFSVLLVHGFRLSLGHNFGGVSGRRSSECVYSVFKQKSPHVFLPNRHIFKLNYIIFFHVNISRFFFPPHFILSKP